MTPDMRELGNSVLKRAIKESGKKLVERSFYGDLMGFIHAVRWTEPWVAGILTFHVVLAGTAWATRRSANFQIFLFLYICALVYGMQYANDYLAVHWRTLGFTQNYFDPSGLFISFVVAMPMLLIAMSQMLYALATSASLVVKVKKAELQQQRAAKQQELQQELQQQQQQKGSGSSSSSSAAAPGTNAEGKVPVVAAESLKKPKNE